MRVLVEVDGVNRLLTYDAPDDVQVGARVRVPIAVPGLAYEITKVGVVNALGSEYQGAAKKIIEVLP